MAGKGKDMNFKDRYDFEFLVNEAERLVVEELERQLSLPVNRDLCACEDCVLDMAAYALNNIRPVYRASLLGRLYAEALDETDYRKEVEEAVTKSVEKISQNPSHENKEEEEEPIE